MLVCIKRDAESNETTPAISVPSFHEDIYVYNEVSIQCLVHSADHLFLMISRRFMVVSREESRTLSVPHDVP